MVAAGIGLNALVLPTRSFKEQAHVFATSKICPSSNSTLPDHWALAANVFVFLGKRYAVPFCRLEVILYCIKISKFRQKPLFALATDVLHFRHSALEFKSFNFVCKYRTLQVVITFFAFNGFVLDAQFWLSRQLFRRVPLVCLWTACCERHFRIYWTGSWPSVRNWNSYLHRETRAHRWAQPSVWYQLILHHHWDQSHCS